MGYAFDTNVIIHLMRGTQSVRENKDKALLQGEHFVIPPFVNYELLRGLMIKPITSHENAYAVIRNNCTLGEMTVDAWVYAAKIYAELYTKRFTVRDSDIVITAFCIVNDYTLVTSNIKDFANIDGLRLVDWVY